MDMLHAAQRGIGDEIRARSTVPRNPDDSLVPLLVADRVPMEKLYEDYGPLLELVRALIGVAPNCDTYLEIWPPAFRTYNIMVPNFLNLPAAIFGLGAARDHAGLGMYVASRTAECSYCSAHTCSYALRRGAVLETVAHALEPGRAFSSEEKAVIAVARSLARIPCELTREERRDLERRFTHEEAEWILYGIVNMGFLNKFMDAVGVELEETTVAETATTMGADWTAGKADGHLPSTLSSSLPPEADDIRTKLRILPYLPKARYLDVKWLWGIPTRWPGVGEYLRSRTGHDFPILARIRQTRVLRAAAGMLRENLDPSTSQIGLPLKVLAGIIFCETVSDHALANDVRALADHHELSADLMDAARARANGAGADAARGELDEREVVFLELARAIAPSPAEVTPALVARLRESGVRPAEIIELVSWIAVLQMLHRLTCYFET